ncbi:YajG family lipoprotein [Ferrimonas senticii]|uniref:YajG family lipoprotein n=1 Tax=Ferrimonas senticii TaxID=394566 RepID=UPI00041F0E81|nr:YajG family lipoprotein [Ferrimonas senticii]
MNHRITLTLLATLALLGGCANQPHQLILKPVETQVSQALPSHLSLSVSSRDLRSETYLGRITEAGEPALLLNATVNPRQLFEDGLRQGLAQQGYAVSADQGDVAIALQLDRLVVDVEQFTLKHSGNSEAAITLVLSNAKQQLTKRFSAKGSFNGVMAVEASEMETHLNQQVQQLLNAVLKDQEIQQFIQGSEA